MRIGRHMPTHSKMVKAAEIAQQIGCETIQIFASNPTGWRPPADNDEGCAAFAQAACAYELDPVVLHAPYLINLGTTDDNIWHKSVSLLTWTMQRGTRLGAKYVVFHTGSHRGAGVTVGLAQVAQGIENILRESPPTPTDAIPKGHTVNRVPTSSPDKSGSETRPTPTDAINRVPTSSPDKLGGETRPTPTDAINRVPTFSPDKSGGEMRPQVMLLLENDVGAGNSLGHSFEQLAAILAQLPQYQDRLGICIDTAHLWGAGYDISSQASTLQVLQNCEDTFGLARLKVIHLNDTAMALGSHRDVHKRLGEGIIGSEGLQTLLRDPRLAHVAVLMETPIKTDEHNKEDWTHDMGQILKAKALR
jgi:endonuclease IV